MTWIWDLLYYTVIFLHFKICLYLASDCNACASKTNIFQTNVYFELLYVIALRFLYVKILLYHLLHPENAFKLPNRVVNCNWKVQRGTRLAHTLVKFNIWQNITLFSSTCLCLNLGCVMWKKSKHEDGYIKMYDKAIRIFPFKSNSHFYYPNLRRIIQLSRRSWKIWTVMITNNQLRWNWYYYVR